jgi:hypothetical protein
MVQRTRARTPSTPSYAPGSPEARLAAVVYRRVPGAPFPSASPAATVIPAPAPPSLARGRIGLCMDIALRNCQY